MTGLCKKSRMLYAGTEMHGEEDRVTTEAEVGVI